MTLMEKIILCAKFAYRHTIGSSRSVLLFNREYWFAWNEVFTGIGSPETVAVIEATVIKSWK